MSLFLNFAVSLHSSSIISTNLYRSVSRWLYLAFIHNKRSLYRLITLCKYPWTYKGYAGISKTWFHNSNGISIPLLRSIKNKEISSLKSTYMPMCLLCAISVHLRQNLREPQCIIWGCLWPRFNEVLWISNWYEDSG